jgi:DHA1 family bicyclomycin/chloramphenicol resistance-like MFS transporter
MVISSSANGLVAGVLAPLVMHSTLALALALSAMAMMGIGLGAWLWLHLRWPTVGRRADMA